MAVQQRNQRQAPANRQESRSMSVPVPVQDLTTYLRTYARQRPDVAALWCFGIGFVLGWKLKPW
jgi:hypothetical protein